MKNQRGDGMRRETTRYHLNSKFWRRNNKNKVTVPVSPERLAELKQMIERFRQIGAVRAIEEQALARFAHDSRAYLTPERIKSLTLS